MQMFEDNCTYYKIIIIKINNNHKAIKMVTKGVIDIEK